MLEFWRTVEMFSPQKVDMADREQLAFPTNSPVGGHRFAGLTAGAIHVAQGKQADIVVLVLGSAPGKPGARRRASATPNLLNVAISRAKRRLYVVGDRQEWSKWPYFKTLAASLPYSRPVEPPPVSTT